MISETEAINIAEKHHGPGFHFFSITHGAADISASLAYVANARKWHPDDVWCVLCSAHPGKMMLCSSRAIIISKDTGEILYDGDAGDEG